MPHPDRLRLLTMLASTAVMLCGPVAAQTNLVKNPSFEDGQGQRAAGWDPAKTAGRKGVVERTDKTAHTGHYSLRIAPNSANRGSQITDDPVGAGQGFPGKDFLGTTVIVSAWLAASGGATATVAVYAIGRSGPRYVEINQDSSSGQMVRQTAELSIPPNDIDFVVVLCLAKGTSGEAWIDDVSMSIGGAPAESRAAELRQPEAVSGKATIAVNAARVIRQIPRELYGTNIEWVWDGNGIWDAAAGRLNAEIVDLARDLQPSLLRFPGGIFSDFYHWRDGIGPRDERKPTAHSPSGGESVHRFGTDEALEFARQVGGELLITVNLATGTAEDAADWVRYVNGKGRRVRYWEVGNEIYVKDNSPHSRASTMPPEAYAAKFVEFSRRMKEADPGIQVGALGEENYGNAYASYPNWTQVVLERAATDMDFLAVHNGYAPAIISERNLKTEDVYLAMLAAPAQMARSLEELDRKIQRHAPGDAGRIRIAVTEWGPYFQVSPQGKWVDHPKTLASALLVASVLHTFFEQPRMHIANAFKLVDPLYMGWIGKRGEHYIPQASYFATQLYTKHFGSRLLETRTQSPGFDAPAVGWVRAAKNVPYLDAVASRDTSGNRIFLTVVNKNLTDAISTRVEIEGAEITEQARAWVLNGMSPDANTGSELFQAPGVKWARQAEYEKGGRFSKGGPDEVKREEHQVRAGNRFDYTFPAHSITTFEMTAQ